MGEAVENKPDYKWRFYFSCWVAFLFFYMSAYKYVDYTYFPVLELEQLKKRTGIVEQMRKIPRVGGYMTLRASDGSVHEYNARAAYSESLVGKEVTVWSRPELTPFYQVEDAVVQFQHQGKLLVEYAPIKETWESQMLSKWARIIWPAIFGFAACLVAYWFKRKSKEGEIGDQKRR